MIKLELKQLELLVNLGLGEEERSVKQNVWINFSIMFEKLPNACLNDSIDETHCYFNITNKIKELCYGREFKLLEHLCHEIYNVIKKDTSEKISVTVIKNPPIFEVKGGASFTIGD